MRDLRICKEKMETKPKFKNPKHLKSIITTNEISILIENNNVKKSAKIQYKQFSGKIMLVGLAYLLFFMEEC